MTWVRRGTYEVATELVPRGKEFFRPLSDGTLILKEPIRILKYLGSGEAGWHEGRPSVQIEDNKVTEDLLYRGVWLVQQLGVPFFYPSSKTIGRMYVETLLRRHSEPTRTIVLFPDQTGNLSERFSSPEGKRLAGYKVPHVADAYNVHWNGE